MVEGAIDKLRSKAADLTAKMGAISQAAGDNALTDEQRIDFDKHEA